MSVQFQKKIEAFVCEKCGEHVAGNGYTDHCPACLWSKHVDIFPGDRNATCGGMMEPVEQEMTNRGHDIVYRCMRCHYEHRNKVAHDDNQDLIAFL